MALINGTSGNDSLPGTSDNDVINGLQGDDTIDGGAGNDTLDGGSGNDIFLIGNNSGYDQFYGGDGTDTIRLREDVTTSSFLLSAANVHSVEQFNFNYNSVAGTNGDDVFDISGITTVYGTYYTFQLNEGNDRFTGYSGADYVNGGAGNDTLDGGAGADLLNGGSGNDLLIGGLGDDIFEINGNDFGQDTFNGGDGTDTVRLRSDIVTDRFTLNSATMISTEQLNFNYNSVAGTNGNDIFDISGVTTVYGTYYTFNLNEGNDRFTGYVGADYVNGGAGNDTLDGGAGADLLNGGSGNDLLIGGSGDDIFEINGNDFGQDTFNGGEGTDTVRLRSNIVTDRFILNSTTVINTEQLNFNYSSVAGTTGDDVFDISGMTTVYGTYYTFQMNEGNDRFTGYIGADYVNGGAGNDTLDGGAGADLLNGGAGNDLLIGGSGDDIFELSGNDFGRDTLQGGTGTDTLRLRGDITTNAFIFNAGNTSSVEQLNFNYNSVAGTGGDDVFDISGFTSVSGSYYTFNLNDGNDRFTGYGGADYVDGGAGNDTLTGGAGDDRLNGGSGLDTASYADATSGVSVDLRIATAQAVGGGRGSDTLTSIEYLTGSAYGDRLTGNAGGNLLSGGAGNDTLDGGAGNDVLSGGTGVDTASYANATSGVTVNLAIAVAQAVGGGQGSDRLLSIESLLGSAYGDRLTGTAGANVLSGGAGNDTLVGGLGNDTLAGGAGVDTADYSGATAVRVNLGVTTAQNTGYGLDVLSAIENVTGGNANDVLTGSAGANVLSGGAGNDTLSGGAGNDTLDGGAGNDVLAGGAGVDTARFLGTANITVDLSLTRAQNTGQGLDTLSQIESVLSGSGNDRLTGSAGANVLSAGAGNDTLSGGAGNDTLDGGLGNDLIDGGTGVDTIIFVGATPVRVNLGVTTAQNTGQGLDTIRNIENATGGNGNDTLTGTAGANVLGGGAGNDALSGGAGNDTLSGGTGNDTLTGGAGSDVLTGGVGQDVFAFDTASGADRIADFQDGQDIMQIRWAGHSYAELDIRQVGANTVIGFGTTTITLTGINAWTIGASDFNFV